MPNEFDSDKKLEDSELFRSAMKKLDNLKPLDQDKIRSPKRKRAKPIPSSGTEENTSTLADSDYLPPIDADAFLQYQGPGLQHKQFKKLKAGQMALEARLDLHGLRRHQAETALDRFIRQCQLEEIRSVIVVHGKGQADRNQNLGLKALACEWLKNDSRVIAFCSAQPQHGGRGAVYVLIKKAPAMG